MPNIASPKKTAKDAKISAVYFFAGVAQRSKWHTRRQNTRTKMHFVAQLLVCLCLRIQTKLLRKQLLCSNDDTVPWHRTVKTGV